MSSDAEAELSAIFIMEKELLTMRQTPIDMVWPQLPTPKETDNFTAAGVVNETIVAQKTKSMDLKFNQLRCHESQQKNRFYWAPGSNSWADYRTKHHLPIYHESNHTIFAGAI